MNEEILDLILRLKMVYIFTVRDYTYLHSRLILFICLYKLVMVRRLSNLIKANDTV